jgi:hypothetical protein
MPNSFSGAERTQTNAAAAHSKLVAVDRGVRLRRPCSGRRVGSHCLDCTGTVGILVFFPVGLGAAGFTILDCDIEEKRLRVSNRADAAYQILARTLAAFAGGVALYGSQ